MLDLRQGFGYPLQVLALNPAAQFREVGPHVAIGITSMNLDDVRNQLSKYLEPLNASLHIERFILYRAALLRPLGKFCGVL